MSEKLYPVSIEVNSTVREAQVPARLSLLDFVRDTLRLTGTHAGCEHGICGACSVLLDARAVRSCLMYAVQADGCKLTTIEGLAQADGTPGALQDAFCETHATQCGYCTPGMIVAAHALLETNHSPTEHEIREAIGGNLCRCTGYQQIVDAIKLAAVKRIEGKA